MYFCDRAKKALPLELKRCPRWTKCSKRNLFNVREQKFYKILEKVLTKLKNKYKIALAKANNILRNENLIRSDKNEFNKNKNKP